MTPAQYLRNLCIAALLAGTAGLHAATITYNNRAAFDAAAGATTLVDFEAESGGNAISYYGSSLTVGDVTFTDNAPRLFVLDDSVYNTSVGSHYLNNNSVGAVVGINFANPVYSVGMDLGYVWSWGGGMSVDLQLSNGDSFNVGLQQLANQQGLMIFWGAVSDVAITGITIQDYTQGLAIDNLAYTQSPGNPVPDSGATLLLCLGSLLAIAGFRSRR